MQSYKTSLNMKYKPPITWCIMLRPLLMELSLCPSLCPPCWVFGASPSFCMIVFTNWSSVTLRRTFSCCIILLKWQIPKLKDHNRRMWINFPSPFFIYLPPVHSFFDTCSFFCFLFVTCPFFFLFVTRPFFFCHLSILFLSDPSPIIANACQWFTDSLTHWLTP